MEEVKKKRGRKEEAKKQRRRSKEEAKNTIKEKRCL
jgi:hypothetical protein